MEVAEPARFISRDISVGERAEAELDVFIGCRHDRRVAEEGERPAEQAWVESVRRFHAEQQKALALEWLSYYQQRREGNRRMFSLIDSHHEQEIRRYERMLGLDAHEMEDVS